VARMAPIYEMFTVPGQSDPTFNLVETFVPSAASNQIQTMSGFLVAGSDPSDYGKLTMFQTTPPIDGPALVDADISGTQAISKQISLLNQNGSSVLLGSLQVVPIADSMLYFRPFYVTSSRNAFPKLDYYIVVYAGQQGTSKVAFDTTLQAALNDLFQVSLPGSSGPSSTGPSAPVSATVQNLVTQANQDFQQAQTDLKNGQFAAYGSEIAALQNVLQKLQQQSSGTGNPHVSTPGKTKSTTTTTTDTTTTVPSGVALGKS